METYNIDNKDAHILELLQQNSKVTVSQLARRIGMPATTIHNRIKRLERQGIISGYCVKVDHKKLGMPICAYVLVDIDYEMHYEVVAKLKSMPFIERMESVTGGTDIILTVRAKSPDELSRIVLRELRTKGVKKTETLFVLEELK